MRPFVRRRLLVAGLILAAGAAALALRVDDPQPPALPPIDALTTASGWRAEAASAPVVLAVRYRQWLLRDRTGGEVLLYLGATARARAMLAWSGELGYEGEGYVAVARRDASLVLAGGRRVTVGGATIQRLGDRRLVRYGVVGPSGVAPRGLDLLLPAAWELLRGRPATYYLVRVAVADGPGAEARAGDVLAAVLPRLLAIAERP
jgi:Protein of unknown function (DUF3485)